MSGVGLTHFHPVVPAGGSGTRLWPLSRRSRPKFLLPLESGRSLLQGTVQRLGTLAPPSRLLVVTGAAHADAVRAQLPTLPAGNVLVEPEPRESAPAIALAAAVALTRDPDAVTGSFAADHLVRDLDAFETAVRAAVEAAAGGRLVTIGITPTRPETGYGYINTEPTGNDASPVRRVNAFREKPDRATAQAYLAAGNYLWNAGMFVWRADVFLTEVRRQLPTLYDGVTAIAAALAAGDEGAPALLAEVWPSLPRVSVDVGVIEGAAAAGSVSCVPAALGWTDIGDWDTLGSLLEGGTGGHGGVTAIDSEACVVWGEGRHVVLLGVSDLVVADTEDALLVCPRARAQEVGDVVARLRGRGRDELT